MRTCSGVCCRRKVTLFAVFFGVFTVIAGLNLWIADRVAPRFVPGERASVRRAVPRRVRPPPAPRALRHRARSSRCCWRFPPSRCGRTGCCSATLVSSASPTLSSVPTSASTSSSCRSCRSRSTGCSSSLIVVLLLTAAAHILNGGVVFVSPVPGRPPGDQGPPGRAARGARRGEGGRLLARPLRHHQHRARHRAGRHLLGGQGATPGDHAADPDRAADRRPVPLGRSQPGRSDCR